MHIIAVGLNYRTAPVEVRERFSIAPSRLSEALLELRQTKSILECVIVGTCNRTELYAVVDRHHVCGHYIRSFMENWFGVPRQAFNEHLYILEDDAAIRHLFRVACGLDSMIIGETQILGQVKEALFAAQAAKTTGTLLNTLFKQAVTAAKRAHSETSIGENPVSVSYAAVELGKRIFGSFEGKTVMIIGAGKMSELTLKHLHAGGADRMMVVNRTLSRAEELAEKIGGAACTLAALPEGLGRADIVISSTGSSELVLTKEQVGEAMRKRKSKPLFMIDIAVPRDLDPAIAELPNVFLYDIDDLESIVSGNLEERRKEAAKIEIMIGEELEAFRQWYRTLGVGPVIAALQQKASVIHRETMDSLMKKLPELNEREAEVIRKLTKSMLNQMMKDPIVRIKEMAAKRSGSEALDRFAHLFALEEALADMERDGAAAVQAEVPGRASAAKEETYPVMAVQMQS